MAWVSRVCVNHPEHTHSPRRANICLSFKSFLFVFSAALDFNLLAQGIRLCLKFLVGFGVMAAFAEEPMGKPAGAKQFVYESAGGASGATDEGFLVGNMEQGGTVIRLAPDEQVDPAGSSAKSDDLASSVCSIFGVAVRKVNFLSGSAELTEQAKTALQRPARVMLEHPDLVLDVRAHTDALGSAEANMQLSQLRAQSVQQFFVAYGVQKQRLQVAGLGETEPVASNSTESGRRQNRRVEFRLLNTRPKQMFMVCD